MSTRRWCAGRHGGWSTLPIPLMPPPRAVVAAAGPWCSRAGAGHASGAASAAADVGGRDPATRPEMAGNGIVATMTEVAAAPAAELDVCVACGGGVPPGSGLTADVTHDAAGRKRWLKACSKACHHQRLADVVGADTEKVSAGG